MVARDILLELQIGVEQMGCRTTGMSKNWDVQQLGCRRNGLSNNWDFQLVPVVRQSVEQLGCRTIGMSNKWDDPGSRPEFQT